jgi:hypothetical protein
MNAMKSLIIARLALLGILVTMAFGAFAVCQDGTEISSVEVIPEAYHGTSLPLRQIVPSLGSAHPMAGASSGKGTVSTTIELSFDGIGSSPHWLTADTSGAVGATQYVQSVNAKFAVYNKTTGALEYGPVQPNTVFMGFGGPCQTSDDGDPSTQYDKAAGRWVLSRHSSGPPFYECFAVSTTSDATGSYYLYAFQLPTSYWPDYPKVGVWPDAYYVTFNLQNQAKQYGAVAAQPCAVDRNSMLTGAAATMICFQVAAKGHDLTILPSDLDGATPPPAGAPNYFLGLSTNSLHLYKFHVDFQTPTNSTFKGPKVLAVSAFTEACNGKNCVPQLDTNELVGSLGDRLMNRVAYRNFTTYDVLAATHSVTAGTPPVAAIRWYVIRNPAGPQTFQEQGTFHPDANFRWVGSIGMDQAGDLAIGYSVSSSTMHPAIRYSGRTPNDPHGTLETEASIMEGGGSQQPKNTGWTDVTSMSIDPVDDCTFWYTNQYYQTDSMDGWSSHIASFKFLSCP